MSGDSDGIAEDLQSASGLEGMARAMLPAWFWGLLVLLPCVAFSFWAATHQQARKQDLRTAALAKVDAEPSDTLVLAERIRARIEGHINV